MKTSYDLILHAFFITNGFFQRNLSVAYLFHALSFKYCLCCLGIFVQRLCLGALMSYLCELFLFLFSLYKTHLILLFKETHLFYRTFFRKIEIFGI